MTYQIHKILTFYWLWMATFLSLIFCSTIYLIISDFDRDLGSGIGFILFIALVSLIKEISESNGKKYNSWLDVERDRFLATNQYENNNFEAIHIKSHVSSILVYVFIFIVCIFSFLFIDEQRYFVTPLIGLVGAKYAEFILSLYKRNTLFFVIVISYLSFWLTFWLGNFIEIGLKTPLKGSYYVLSITVWFAAGMIFQLLIFGIDKLVKNIIR